MSRSYFKHPYGSIHANERRQMNTKRFAKKHLNNNLRNRMKRNIELDFSYCVYKKIKHSYYDELIKIPLFSDVENYNYLDRRRYTKQQLSK